MEITCLAAVALKAKERMQIREIIVSAPLEGEIRLRVLSNALCHTDVYTLDGHDPEGVFPCILGHEAVGEVESVGKGVKSVKVGDIVIPCYVAECQEKSCIFCESKQTNLCPKVRGYQGRGVMSDGRTRFRLKHNDEPIYHFMGCSTFSEYTVINEIQAAKVPLLCNLYDTICMLGCGVSTGWGAVYNTCQVKSHTSVLVFGLGAVGLSVIQMAKQMNASLIVGVDLIVNKFEIASSLGMTTGVDANSEGLQAHLISISPQNWGYDYTFDCTGNTTVMRMALELAHRGWGQSCVIGVAASGHEISTRPFQLVTGRQWKGTAFGGWKSRSQVPYLIKKVLTKQLPIEQYLTHKFNSLEDINRSVDMLHSGESLRSVIQINPYPAKKDYQVAQLSNQKLFNGQMQQFKHKSFVNNCEMTFSIYLPSSIIDNYTHSVPVIYFLSGLQSTDESARTKSFLPFFCEQHQIAIVFPDTSPRNLDIDFVNANTDWSTYYSAGFYLDATKPQLNQHFNMYSYIDQELQLICQSLFNIDPNKQSISGFSMGGHGAMISYLKNIDSQKYKSISAIAPIVNPINCQWGKTNFQNYLNNPEQESQQYDSIELIKQITKSDPNTNKIQMLIDFATEDQFNINQLLPQNLQNIKEQLQLNNIQINWNQGYQHGYWLVSSLAQKHVEYHAKFLKQ